MTVEELIAALQKYPGHFTVQALRVRSPKRDDLVADFVDVTNHVREKIVNLELDGVLGS
ncbi:MAG TPA: hypothetical protein VGO57_02420 [Verrucomicrobiae bacterium]